MFGSRCWATALTDPALGSAPLIHYYVHADLTRSCAHQCKRHPGSSFPPPPLGVKTLPGIGLAMKLMSDPAGDVSGLCLVCCRRVDRGTMREAKTENAEA